MSIIDDQPFTMAEGIGHLDPFPEKRPIWSDVETNYFLKLLVESHVPEHLESNKYRNASVFQALEEPMRSAGFNRSYTQLRIKWKNLKKTFVDARRAREMGISPLTICPFYDKLEQLIGNQPIRRRSDLGALVPALTVQDVHDVTSNGSDFREDFDNHHDEATMELLSHYVNKTSSTSGMKEENPSVMYPHMVQTSSNSRSHQVRNLGSLQRVDPDELFLAMILPDIKKLSAQKKRRVKMEIQKLLDVALTEEDQ